jgi:glycerate 2-kinase
MRPKDRLSEDLLTEIFYSGLKAVDPYRCVLPEAKRIQSLFRQGHHSHLYVVAFGKASVSMAKAVAEIAEPDVELRGIVITKYGHSGLVKLPGKVKVFEAGHPIPDVNGVTATAEAVGLLKESDESTLVVCLISGGGSALLVSPQEDITLQEKQAVTDLLLRAGADIVGLNTVRKHLSRVKGGRLAELAHPSRVVSFILSDVIGDPLDVIASGPTSPDTTTYGDALEVIRKHGIDRSVPKNVLRLLQKGAAGFLPETPKPGSPLFQATENIIVGSNRLATAAAAKKAEELGFTLSMLSNEVSGEAREAGVSLAKQALQIKNARKQGNLICLLQGGETTVTVRGKGRGGRNTEFALSFAVEIAGTHGISMLSAGTDGTDGPTDAAGAIADGETVGRMEALGLDPTAYLNENDSYTCFQKAGGLFITGPTGTNVMDLQIVLIT